MVLCEKWNNLVELEKGARPPVNEHERQNLLVSMGLWTHMDEVHVQACVTGKGISMRGKRSDSWLNIIKLCVPSILVLKCGYWLSMATCFFQSNSCLQ